MEFFLKRKNMNTKKQKQLLEGTTSSNVSALTASLSPLNRIAQAKKPFIIGEELIPPAAKDICPELLQDAAAQVASSVTR